MAEYQITCIHKPHRHSPHEHITHIGNLAGNWCLTRESAIRRIDANTDTFFTVDPATGRRVNIGVVRNDGMKAPYLKTYADGVWRDNLLALAECSPTCKVIE